jgi:hypothetical protein
MSTSHESVEEKSQALRFTVQRGTARGSGYVLKDSGGLIVMGEGFTASLKQIDKHLDDYVVQKAKALGLRLTTQKVAPSLHELSSGEARAAQTRTVGYKLEHKEVLKDKGRREETRKEKEDRAIAGGQKIEWITVLGYDYSATLSEIITYLTDHANDVGLDDDDVEIDVNKKPKVAPPSLQKMGAALKGHDNAAEISRIGVGNQAVDRRPKKREIDLRNTLEVGNIVGYRRTEAFKQLSPAEQKEHFERMREAQRELDKLERAKNNYDEQKETDPFLVEQRRQAAAFRLAERRLLRTNKLSRLDIDANLERPGLNRDHDWIERNMLPDPDAPDFQAPAPSRNFAIQTKKDAGQRDHGEVNGGAIDSLREAARQRRLAEAGPKIKALLAARDYENAAIVLDKAKEYAGHGNFLPWLEQAGIDKQAAQRCMRRQKRH